MKKEEVSMLGQMVPCPKFNNAQTGGGMIYLEECVKCDLHKGIDLVREANEEKGELEINNIMCAIPTQIRITHHIGTI